MLIPISEKLKDRMGVKLACPAAMPAIMLKDSPLE